MTNTCWLVAVKATGSPTPLTDVVMTLIGCDDFHTARGSQLTEVVERWKAGRGALQMRLGPSRRDWF